MIPTPIRWWPGRLQSALARSLCVWTTAVVLLAPAPAPATPGQWWDGFQAQGFDGTVFALTVYHGQLIAGGAFSHAGPVEANNIARWDGAAWAPLGEGISNGADAPGFTPYVAGLTVHNDDLIAVGQFTRAGGAAASSVARWNGDSWTTFDAVFNGILLAAISFQGELIVAGRFTQVNEQSLPFIARWTGVDFHTLGGGINGGASALAVYGEALAVGGYFTRVERQLAGGVGLWNGAWWETIGSGLSGGHPISWVFALAVYRGDLIAGGAFTQADGNSVLGIARWDGTAWQRMGVGIRGQDSTWVFGLAEYGGELIAAGNFVRADGQFVNYLASWDGTGWTPLGEGADDWARTLVVLDRHLYVGGDFSVAGGLPSPGIARWDGRAVPVLLSAFSARREEGRALLRWELAGDGPHAIFHVHRRDAATSGATLERITPRPLLGAAHMEFTDPSAPLSRTEYFLEQVDGGASRWHGPAVLESDLAGAWDAGELALLPGTPNPFDAQTSIRFGLPRGGDVLLTVHDTRGRTVATLVDGALSAGAHAVIWDGRDRAGAPAAQGVYLARLRFSGRELTRKLVLAANP
jgi:hypothetical protein